jgi:hypothetical protein
LALPHGQDSLFTKEQIMSDATNVNSYTDSLSLIEKIVAANPSKHKRMIHDFLASREAVFNRLSYTIARKFSAEHAREDIRQIVMIEAHEMIQEAISDRESLEEIHSFEGLLQARAHAKSRTYLDRDDIGITHVTTIKRRQRMLMATREAMMAAAVGDVTDQSVVDAHNTKVNTTRTNARKQGMIATIDDMRHNFTVAGESELADVAGASDNTNSNTLMHPLEGKKFIIEMLRRCDELHPELGEFARAWIESVYLDGDSKPDDRTLAKRFGMTRAHLSDTIAEIREIARDTLHDILDIGEDDYLAVDRPDAHVGSVLS